jgi:hypothetical protein
MQIAASTLAVNVALCLHFHSRGRAGSNETGRSMLPTLTRIHTPLARQIRLDPTRPCLGHRYIAMLLRK